VCSSDLKDDQLRELFVDDLPEGVSLTAILDCCFSGTVMDLEYSYKLNDKLEPTIVTNSTSNENGNKSIVMISRL